jgi:hypothetical protein
MRLKSFRLLPALTCLAVALWIPKTSLGIDACPPDYCGDMRNQCENTGGQFTQTPVDGGNGICLHNGSVKPVFEGICEYPNQGPWGDACWGI